MGWPYYMTLNFEITSLPSPPVDQSDINKNNAVKKVVNDSDNLRVDHHIPPSQFDKKKIYIYSSFPPSMV